MKKITDSDFVYRDSANTDLAATFRRIRREQKEREQAQQVADDEAKAKVRKIRAERRGT